MHLIGRCEEVFLRASYPCGGGGGGVAGEVRGGISTKTSVRGKEACIDHGFKIPFVDGKEHIDTGPKADQLTRSGAFI